MTDSSSFMFTVSLAAVINGLGIVRLLGALAEYLRIRSKLEVTHYWVYGLLLLFQFLLHVLLWWSLWGVRGVDSFNFLNYLYLLIGPILLFLAGSLLLPELKDGVTDLREQYFQVARPYFTVMGLAWLWVIGFWPVLLGVLAPTAPIIGSYFIAALILRSVANEWIHAVLVVGHYVVLTLLIGLFGMQLGGVGKLMTDRLQP